MKMAGGLTREEEVGVNNPFSIALLLGIISLVNRMCLRHHQYKYQHPLV